jgi:protein phosphatase
MLIRLRHDGETLTHLAEFDKSKQPPAEGNDKGNTRDENQDAWLADPDLGLFLVADGMGGHLGGATAARIVADVMQKVVRQYRYDSQRQEVKSLSDWLAEQITGLSNRLYQESSTRPGLAGMGATLVTLMFEDDRAYVAHLGDSRAYLFRHGELSQLTEDHSVVGILLRNKEITLEEAVNHPARGKLTCYVGMATKVRPDVQSIPIQPADRFLLCSDGLTGLIPKSDICKCLATHGDPQAACRALVDAANDAGGTDNTTAVIVDWTAALEHPSIG